MYIQERENDMMTEADILSKRVNYFLTMDTTFELDTFLTSKVEAYSKDINSRVIIVDKYNRVKSDSNNDCKGETFKHTEIKKALQGIKNSNIYNFKDVGYVMYVAVPIEYDGKIIGTTLISTSLEDIYNAVGQIGSKLRIISILSILLIAVISFVFASYLFQPIKEFKKAITKLSQGDLNYKIKINTRDEFDELANTFNSMSTKLNEVDIQRKDFVANVSHELRTPLSSIKLLSESLLHQNEGNIMIYREFLGDIDSEIDRLNNIITELLTLVDLDKEKLQLNYKITYVNFLLEKVVAQLKPLAEKRKIKLKFVEKEKIQIKIDADKIQQAIINIIDNAIKYTADGGKVEVSLYTENKYVMIRIKDNGVGIPKESISNIFDRFYRVDKARSRKTGGTGLGLSIAHQVITLHQGNIRVESEIGKGSIFYIAIPYNI